MTMINRLAIIAGGGELPLKAFHAAIDRGIDTEVIALKGFTEARVKRLAVIEVGLGEIGKVQEQLARSGRDSLLLCGLVKRPDLASLRVDWKGVSVLARVVSAARKGDDALLRELATIFEEGGVRVIGVDEIATGLLAQEGTLTGAAIQAEHEADIEKAISIARLMGSADIGQGAVVAQGLVLAVEAQEGTDAMLARVGKLPVDIRGTIAERRGVLAKVRKPIQDKRLDLPTIGVNTVEGAFHAGLAGIVVEAEGALILDRDGVIARAEELGLFVCARKLRA
jgi:UDP-2,3-diacylglucosamine hydrolase